MSMYDCAVCGEKRCLCVIKETSDLNVEINYLKDIIGHACYIIKNSRAKSSYPNKEHKEEVEMFMKSTEGFINEK